MPDAIANLARAGIKIWVLTGDKVETAINIGAPLLLLLVFTCCLFSPPLARFRSVPCLTCCNVLLLLRLALAPHTLPALCNTAISGMRSSRLNSALSLVLHPHPQRVRAVC